MTITVKWYDDAQTIIYIHYAGKWAWQEYYATSREVTEMAKSVTYPIYIMSNMEPDSPIPPGDSMSIFKQGIAMLPDNVVLIVACNAHSIARAIGNALIKLTKFGNRMVFASSVENGLEIISRSKQMAAG